MLNAFIERFDEPATGEGPLTGWTYAVKANIDLAGRATTAGSPAFADAVAVADASIVSMIRDAGAALAGVANMHELAFGVTSNNAAHGAVRNPVDPRFSAGGSSGGGAAAVASGEVRFALSTDTGGSVSIPAAFCGVVGLRPTSGRYPADGVLGLSPTRDTIGLHARTVADIRVVDDVIVPARAVETPDPRGLRLGMPRSRYDDIDPAVAAAMDTALAELRRTGVRLVDVELPGDLADAVLGEDLVLHEAPSQLLARRPDLTLAGLAAQVASPDVRFLLESLAADPVGPDRYREARRARARLRRVYADVLSDVDALVFPTCPVLPPPVGVDDVISLGGRLAPLFPTVTRNTGPGAVAGVPAVTLPEARFVGLTLEGAVFDDSRLLAIAQAIAG